MKILLELSPAILLQTFKDCKQTHVKLLNMIKITCILCVDNKTDMISANYTNNNGKLCQKHDYSYEKVQRNEYEHLQLKLV